MTARAPAPGGACRPTWRVSRDADTRPGSLLRDARAAAAARGRRLPGLRGAQPRAVGGACPRHRDAAVHLARPARRDRELQHRGRLRDPQPRGPGDRAVLGGPSRARGRLPAGHDLHAGHARAGQGPRRDDRRGVRPSRPNRRPSTSPRSRRRSAARSWRPSCASRCPSPSPASSPATSRDAAGRRRRRPGRPDRGRAARRCVRRRPRGAVRVRLGATGVAARCRG